MTTIGQYDKYALLRKVHIFSSIPDWRLYELAAQFGQRLFRSKTVVYRQGDDTTAFYVVYEGRLDAYLEHRVDDTRFDEEHLQFLAPGDVFGEESAMFGALREESVRAVRPTMLLTLAGDDFNALLDEFPKVEKAIELVDRTRQLLRESRFEDYLTEDETPLMISRKHWFWLVPRVGVALFGVGVLPLIALVVGLAFPSLLFLWPILTLPGLFFLTWLGITFLDWRDDLYIITDKRVVSIERLAIINVLSAESPLWAVNTVKIKQDAFEQLIGFGDVEINTITGQVHLRDIEEPEFVSGMVSELITRAKQDRRSEMHHKLQGTIRETLGWDKREQKPPPKPPEKPAEKPGRQTRTFDLHALFGVRFRQGDRIVWRRHPITVVPKVATPLAVLGLVVALTVLRLMVTTGVNLGALGAVLAAVPLPGWGAVLALVLAVLGAWLQYRYADWANDRYALTKDQIIDEEKRPWFGELQQNTARIDSILNVSYEQRNIIETLLNYGHVKVQTGGEGGELTFVNVAHPLEIQQEIFRRMESIRRRKEEAEIVGQQKEIAAWLKAYAEVTHAQDPGPPLGQLRDEDIATNE